MLTPEQIEGERVKFEAERYWCRDLDYSRIPDDGRGSGGVAGGYCSPKTRSAWQAWLARAEIAVGEVGALRDMLGRCIDSMVSRPVRTARSDLWTLIGDAKTMLEGTPHAR